MNVSEPVRRAAQQAIEMVMREIKDARGAVVATEDGFEVASHAESNAQVGRIAAMASSIAALGAVAGEESKLGACNHVLIQAAEGFIVMSQARRADADYIFSIVAGKDAVVGQMIYYARAAATAISEA